MQILREIGVRSMRLLSNNPRKLVAIEGYGLSVTEWLPLEIRPSPSNLRYLTAKRNKLGHILSRMETTNLDTNRQMLKVRRTQFTRRRFLLAPLCSVSVSISLAAKSVKQRIASLSNQIGRSESNLILYRNVQ